MVEAEKQARVSRVKFNKKFINRLIIFARGGKTYKGKISQALDHETFSVQSLSEEGRPAYEVDIYDIHRVL